MTSGIVHKFQGSKVEVQTGLAAAKIITAITRALPAVVSSTAHGYLANSLVTFKGIDGMQPLNGQYFVPTPITANSFALLGVDTTGLNPFIVDSPNNAQSQGVTFTQQCELTGINQQGAATALTDVSTICSTAKEYIAGLPDTGTLALDYNWALEAYVQKALQAAQSAGTSIAVRLTDAAGNFAIFFGIVQQMSFQGVVDGVFKGSCTLKLTGAPILVPIY